MRASATLVVVLALVAGLTACSAPAENPESAKTTGPTDCLAESGEASEAVSADGEVGVTPKVTVDFPLTAKVTERTVLVKGDGDVVAAGDVVSTEFVLYNATSGEEIVNSIAEGQAAELTMSADVIPPGLVNSLQCSTVGSRIAAVIPPSDMWGEQGNANLGISGTDSLLLVADVVAIVPPLKPAEWTEGVPEVELGDTPVVTLPEGEAPTELLLKVLEKGDGATVKTTDTVVLDYQGTSWQTREVFDSSYERGEPITHPANQFVKGFTAALVGQKVGSTVLVTIPAEFAYGTDAAAHELGGQSLVFLIQITGIA